MHRSTTTAERRRAWQAIGLFLILTLAISAVFETLMARQGQMTRMLVTGVMWSPGIAALLCCRLLGRPSASLPWRWGAWRWNLQAWALPAGYGLLMYLPVWLLGLGGSGFGNTETLENWATEISGTASGGLPAAMLYLGMLATLGMVSSASRALGEEIGWRGFLIWEMRKVMPFWMLGLSSGLIWGLWHWPGILFTDYNAGEGNLYLQLALFTLGITADGITYAYFAFRSNSLWPAVILHASHNLFIQAIYTPLTVKGENSGFYIDEFGIMMPIASCLLALYFYRRARREGLAEKPINTS